MCLLLQILKNVVFCISVDKSKKKKKKKNTYENAKDWIFMKVGCSSCLILVIY